MRIDISNLSLPDSEAVLLLKDEVRRLRAAITALADQDATLTDEDRQAIEFFAAMQWPSQAQQIKARAATLRALLERL